MGVQLILEINKCVECKYVTNTNREHDCAFTSAPYPTRWWCTKNNMALEELKVHKVVPDDCPLRPRD